MDKKNKITFSKKDLLFLLIFIFLFLLLFKNFFFFNQTFYERDTTTIEIPFRLLCIQLIKQGNFALWTDSHGNGQPFLANPKMAVFYPPTYFYLILPFFAAFKLHYFLHVIIGWLGFFLLAKSYGMTRFAAFTSTCIFFFSGIYLSSFEFYNHIAALAWMPWILFLQNNNFLHNLTKILAISFLWALLILAGAPVFILITGILSFMQIFLNTKNLKKRLFITIIPPLLSVFICAVQLLPSLEILSQTDRTQLLDYWPLELIQLPNLAVNNFLGNDRLPEINDYWGKHFFDRGYPLYYSFYIGIGGLILFLLNLKKPWTLKQKLLLISFCGFLLLSCGKYSPFYFVYKAIPLLSSIRYPVKFFMGAFFCLSLLSGFSIDNLKYTQRRKNWTILLILSIILCVLFILFKKDVINFLNILFVIEKASSINLLSISLLSTFLSIPIYCLLLFFLVRCKSKTLKKYLVSLLVFLVIIDPLYHNRNINPTVPHSFFSPPSILKTLSPPITIYRLESPINHVNRIDFHQKKLFTYLRKSLSQYTALPYQVRYILNNDFFGLYPTDFSNLMEKIENLSPENKFKILKYLGCNYYIGNIPLFNNLPKITTIEDIPLYINEISKHGKKPTIIFKSISAGSLNQKLSLFLKNDFNPENKVIIDSRLPQLFRVSSNNNEKFDIIPLKESSGYGKYQVNTRKPGIMVFPGNWASGWKAWINNKKTQVFEANIFSKGILLPPGPHKLILRYLPDSFLAGSLISIISIFCLTITWLIVRINSRIKFLDKKRKKYKRK